MKFNAMAPPDKLHIPRRPDPPKDSWWIGTTREQFHERAQQEALRMALTPALNYTYQRTRELE